MQLKYSVLSIFIVAGIFACKKEQIVPLPLKEVSNQANVKIVHASAYNTNYTVQLKVNDNRVSNNLSYSTPFPGGGINTGGLNFPWYLALKPGALNIAMTVPKAGTNTDSLALYSGVANVEANRYYSIYLSDTANKTQTTVITENTELPQSGTSRFKFINLMPNVPLVDLYANANKVASNIAYKSVSPDFTLVSGDTVRFYVRIAGTASNSAPLTLYPSISNPVQTVMTVPVKRLFTIFTRGYSGTTGNRAPAVSLLYN